MPAARPSCALPSPLLPHTSITHIHIFTKPLNLCSRAQTGAKGPSYQLGMKSHVPPSSAIQSLGHALPNSGQTAPSPNTT